MGTKFLANKTLPGVAPAVNLEELEYMAFTGQHEHVHNLFRRIPREDWPQYANKYVLNQTVWGGIEKLRQFLSVHSDQAATEQKVYIDEIVRLFSDTCEEEQNYSKEYFQTILFWSAELISLSLYQEARVYLREAIANGSNKFPELHLQFQSRLARIAADQGNIEEARELLSEVANRPYLIADRNQVPEILYDLGIAALMSGEVSYYKKLLFLGLRFFYTDLDSRARFVDQIVLTFRRAYRVFFSRDVRRSDKLLFLAHWLYFRLPGMRRIARLPMLGLVYVINYFRGEQTVRLEQQPVARRPHPNGNGKLTHVAPKRTRRRRGILITRAMGGIGDLLMMTPGIRALKQKYPNEEITLAIPKRYFAVFQGNPDVSLTDVEAQELNPVRFRRWFNFTDCPAARVETLTAPKVKKSRVEIFARALGIKGLRRWQMQKTPSYFLSDEEIAFRGNWFEARDLGSRPVIGVQLQADETYRNYPHMAQLVRELSRSYHVLIFDSRPITGFDLPNIIKVDRYSIRQAFALASGCDLIIAPDSAFVHLAGALNIAAVSLFGPIDGKVRTRHYPTVDFLDARRQLGCVACWRNEAIPCKLTNMRQSVCMGDIPVREILSKVDEKIGIPVQLKLKEMVENG